MVSHSTVPPTYWTHLGDAGLVRLVVELRDVVVDVLDRDDELGLRLLRLAAPAVDGLSLKDIGSFLLPIELPQRPDLSSVLVDLEDLAGSFSGQDIPDGRVSPVRVRPELERNRWLKTGGEKQVRKEAEAVEPEGLPGR